MIVCSVMYLLVEIKEILLELLLETICWSPPLDPSLVVIVSEVFAEEVVQADQDDDSC